MDKNEFLAAVAKNNIRRHILMPDVKGLPILDDDGNVISKKDTLQDDIKLLEKTKGVEYSKSFLRSMKMTKILDEASEEVLDEDGCECGHNLGRSKELTDKILDKVFSNIEE